MEGPIGLVICDLEAHKQFMIAFNNAFPDFTAELKEDFSDGNV